MHPERKFFEERFGVTDQDLEKYLAEALSAGGEYADLYFEYRASSSISLDESLIKSATAGVSAGVGVRVISGERTGYAYSDDLSSKKILKAAHIAAQIANGPARVSTVGLSEVRIPRNLYPVVVAPTDIEIAEKLELVFRADKAARGYDNRIKQVRAGYADERNHRPDGVVGLLDHHKRPHDCQQGDRQRQQRVVDEVAAYRVRTVLVPGTPQNLDAAFRSPRWQTFLAERGLTFRCHDPAAHCIELVLPDTLVGRGEQAAIDGSTAPRSPTSNLLWRI